MGFESTSDMETKELCGAAWPSKELKGKEREATLSAPNCIKKFSISPVTHDVTSAGGDCVSKGRCKTILVASSVLQKGNNPKFLQSVQNRPRS
jgi:hypothetical protein